jgi:tryptophanyl-tRNA synthetase
VQQQPLSQPPHHTTLQADLVPVGEDQKQHLELTRDIAERVNTMYGGRKWKKRGGRGGNVFKVPGCPLWPSASPSLPMCCLLCCAAGMFCAGACAGTNHMTSQAACVSIQQQHTSIEQTMGSLDPPPSLTLSDDGLKQCA